MQPSRRPSQPARSFRDLRVWQEALLLVAETRPLRALVARSPDRHLSAQLRRAASSVHLNIAEGWGRRTARDRRHFYTEAWSSLQEVEAVLIEIGLDRHVPSALLRPCVRRVHNVTRLLAAFRRRSHEPGC